jgi:hypothetical protein
VSPLSFFGRETEETFFREEQKHSYCPCFQSHTFGKIQLQSEGAEIWIRRVEIGPVNR